MKGTVAFTSLGCDKNRVDSEVMLGLLQERGYQAVADEAEADIIVVNTCCFIRDALEPFWKWRNIKQKVSAKVSLWQDVWDSATKRNFLMRFPK